MFHLGIDNKEYVWIFMRINLYNYFYIYIYTYDFVSYMEI